MDDPMEADDIPVAPQLPEDTPMDEDGPPQTECQGENEPAPIEQGDDTVPVVAADQPIAPEPEADQPIAPEPEADQPIAPEPEADQPSAPEPEADKSVAPKFVADQQDVDADFEAAEEKLEDGQEKTCAVVEDTAQVESHIQNLPDTSISQTAEEDLEEEQPIHSEVDADQPLSTEVEADQPVVSEVGTDQPVNPEVETDQPNEDEAAQPTEDRPVVPEVAADQPTAPEPEADQPSAPEPEADQPVAPEVVSDQQAEHEVEADQQTSPEVNADEKTSSAVDADEQTATEVESVEKTSTTVDADEQTATEVDEPVSLDAETDELIQSHNETEEASKEQDRPGSPANDDVLMEDVESCSTEKENQLGLAEAQATGEEQTSPDDVTSHDQVATDAQIAESSEAETEKRSEDSSEPVLQISSACSQADVDMTDVADGGQKETEVGGLKIASVTSGTVGAEDDDDVVQILDEGGDKSKDKAWEPSKKPMLKLASFADLGSNGISDGTPLVNQEFGVCGQCLQKVATFYNALMWEAMIFCNVTCLADYQLKMSNCATCKKSVLATSLGKYCVRFGSDIKQFCSNVCLEDHKKGLKVCSYCQKDISGGEGFLAPIGDKGQFKDFCMPDCLQKYEALHCGKPLEKEVSACAVCSQVKPVEVQLLLTSDKSINLCGSPCMSAYKFGNNIEAVQCDLCKKEYDSKQYRPLLVIHYSGKSKTFCSVPCQNVYVMQNRAIVPCLWCKVKKYNFDMIEKLSGENVTSTHFCSVNCLNVNTNSKQSEQHLNGMTLAQPPMPVIQSVSSLAGAGEPPARPDRLPTEPVPQSQLQHMQQQQQQQQQVQIVSQTVTNTVKETMVKFPEPIEMKNKGTMAKPFMHTKGVSCRPHPCHKSTQTEGPSLPVIAPVAVPLYMPVPTAMYQKPYPVPIPIPIPIPVPVFIPTTRNSARGIMKHIKKIRSKLPADPFEAELLAMAGALVEKDKVTRFSDDDSDDSLDDDDWNGGAQNLNNANSQDMQMHAAAAAPDLECDIKADRVVPKPLPQVTPDPCTSPQPFAYNRQQVPAVPAAPAQMPIPGVQPTQMQQMRGQPTKRSYSQREDGEEEEDENSPWRQRQNWDGRSKSSRGRNNRAKQPRTDSTGRDPTSAITSMMNKPPEERPDAKHHLKFTYGVNAWKHWVVGKNAELEKARAQGRYMKPFETDILKLRADELNYTLCMFVKEVKKPNGDSYAPDSILYLTLGIQEYLFESGRIDNIFMDTYYEPFTSALHDVVKDFRLPLNEMGYFVTRIEEEHLWESKQLGAHSPQVLLNTLVYFNTKYFMLKTLDDHTKLAFSHIMKHWKNTLSAGSAKQASNSPGNQGRSVLLRYYAPANKVVNRHDDRKCYEQHENTDNPLRCPVKLYEFYLSKCPESMKSRNDTFYLQPERSCVPDSPVWYTASSLVSISLDKMLQRIIMVREVQEHMLADAS